MMNDLFLKIPEIGVNSTESFPAFLGRYELPEFSRSLRF